MSPTLIHDLDHLVWCGGGFHNPDPCRSIFNASIHVYSMFASWWCT